MTFKQVIIVGLIVVMLESIAGYIYLTYRTVPSSLPTPTEKATALTPNQIKKASANLTLQSETTSIKKGQSFTVKALLNTFSNQTSAADLTIKYDPAFLTLIATDSAKAKPFENSEIYQKTVFNSLNSKQGLATMSAVSEEGKPFSGDALLTAMAFKALKVGPTEITIVFTPGETRDTNIVSETKDILESVQNLSITILP